MRTEGLKVSYEVTARAEAAAGGPVVTEADD